MNQVMQTVSAPVAAVAPDSQTRSSALAILAVSVLFTLVYNLAFFRSF